MSVESNAAPAELSSPFYKKNEELCKRWESYILERRGEVKGFYNAWSYKVFAKVKGRKTWVIEVSRSTMTSGNLLLSSKFQNRFESLEFKTLFKETDCKNFCISRSVFRRRRRNHPFFFQLEEFLKDAINDKSLFEARFKDGVLTITFHRRNDWFTMVDQILAYY